LLPGAKEALKFSMEQFENKQADIAELIDKYSGDEGALQQPVINFFKNLRNLL
jgi:hypothetical protein